MKKTKILSITALLLVGVLAFASCAPANTDGKTEDNMETTSGFTGDAFNFELEDTKGDTYTLSDFAGKKVYIKFWASWCSICLAGIEKLEEMDAEYKNNDDIIILTMVSPDANGEMSADKFKQWFSSQGYEFTVLLDEGGSTMDEYGIRGFPTSVFIDTNGNVAETKIGHFQNQTLNEIIANMS